MDTDIDHSRRGFLRGRLRPTPAPIRPPWALAEGDFLAACTRCGECVPACPTHVVVLVRGYPEVDFRRGECTFCAACVTACASGALRRAVDGADAAPAWTIRATVGDACVAGKGVECRICGEHCEAEAIRFSPRLGGPPLPEIRPDACTGCGACVAPCPVSAIRMT